MSNILVSAYYRIPSKAPHEFYQEHLRRFFRFLAGKPIIFFCEEETQHEIRGFGLPLDTVEFVTLPATALPSLTRISYEKWVESCNCDPEKYHTPPLGMIWCCKKEFVRMASERRPTVDWFTWIDAGCIRQDAWESSCKEFTSRRIHTLPPGVYLQCIASVQRKEFYTFPDICIAGAIILFHRQFIHPFIASYMTELIRYYRNNTPFIMDQYIYASMLTKQHEWLHTIPNDTPTVDKWFFFLDWL